MRPLLLILLLLSGCESDERFVSYVQSERNRLPRHTILTGDSNGKYAPVHRQAIIVAHPYEKLRSGMFAVRIDGPNTWTAHPLAYKDGPLWVMWGRNWQSNPAPDDRRLTPSNYLGILVDPVTKEPL